MSQVQDWTWAELQDRAWPSGDHLLTVADAAAQVQQFVDLLIVDVKASDEINRVSECDTLLRTVSGKSSSSGVGSFCPVVAAGLGICQQCRGATGIH